MKTVRKSFFIVCLFLNLFLFSCEDDQEKFDVGSTTQLPPDFLRIEEALTKQINRFQKNVKTRLEVLETATMKQLEELKHRLETLDSAKDISLEQVIYSLKNLEPTIDLKLEQLTHSIPTFESKNAAQIEQLTHRIDAAESTNTSNMELMLTDHLQVFESANDLKFKQLTDCMNYLESKIDISIDRTKQIATNLSRNCGEVKEKGYDLSTVYLIKPDFAPKPITVLCDLEKKGGGWAYILSRFDGSQSFDFDMEEYKNGFGKIWSEFWLGLDNIHYLTGYEDNELLIELVDWDDNYKFAHYDSFRVGSEDEGYIVSISGYTGTAGDSFSYVTNNTKFSTKKIDLDQWSLGSCAQHFGASWWYNMCMTSLLTGKYLESYVHTTELGKIMHWSTFRGNQYSLKEARMMVRPRIEPND
ncbi:fibrinogen-like protein 1 [Zophobas morio]|uniref:fibrinogen-like protein 1 n=1 Tax=Zophobas morio TaxID=2755281 RepID=UPI00308330B5